MSRVVVEFVCAGRKEHRVFTVEAEPGGTLVVAVHHEAVTDVGSHGRWRDRPGPPERYPLTALPLDGMCGCSRSPWWLYERQVDAARASGARRVRLTATP